MKTFKNLRGTCKKHEPTGRIRKEVTYVLDGKTNVSVFCAGQSVRTIAHQDQ